MTSTYLITGAILMAIASLGATAASIQSEDRRPQDAGPVLTVSPTAIFCGQAKVGTAVNCPSLTLTNTGSQTLNFADFVEQKIHTRGDFGLNGCIVVSLAPGESCTWTIYFAAKATGPIQAWDFIVNNGPTNPVIVKLTGIGIN